MKHGRQVVAVLLGLVCFGACGSPSNQAQPATTPVASGKSSATPDPMELPGSTFLPSPSDKAESEVIPPSQPTRLEVGGSYPFTTRVLAYSGTELTPPGGNYQDAFVWTRRGGGLAGDGATDTIYVFGHTYSGSLHDGVFDDLQQVKKGDNVELTTKAGKLRYCVTKQIQVSKAPGDLSQMAEVWAITPRKRRGDMLVLIACLLTEDGSAQTGNNVVVFTRRC